MVEVVDAVDVGAQKGGSTGGGERRSKRARKLRQPVHLSSTTTLHQLKLHLFEVFNVHPKNAQRGRRVHGRSCPMYIIYHMLLFEPMADCKTGRSWKPQRHSAVASIQLGNSL
eukprot:scaffold89949_cov24-Tisochrysis_lutea.AAC.2